MRVARCLILALLLVGCDRKEISVLQIPKGVERIIPEGTASVAEAPSEGDDRVWNLPAGWRETTSNAPMRLATLAVDDAEVGVIEISVTAFPGEVGGELANVNRWRVSIGLPPVKEADLDAEVRRFSRPGSKGYYVRAATADRVMLAGGVYLEARDRTWFVRATTTAAAAERLNQPLLEFLESFGQKSQP